MKNLLETSQVAKISLFFLTIFATALALSDCMLTPPISGTKKYMHIYLHTAYYKTVDVVVAFYFVL